MRYFTHSLKAIFTFTVLFLCGYTASAQLIGTKNIPGDYATLDLAITDLNTQGVGAGGVTLNLIAGNPQITPAGGYAITAIGTAANTILIQGNGNTITAFTPQNSGNVNDAIFKIIGGDFIGITGFTMMENPSNTITTTGTNNMTEWGVALLYSSATNGAQFNAIASNVISLNRTYTNTFGVYSNTRHTATSISTTADVTSPTGSNSGNVVYGNTISNVNMGIAFIGSGVSAFEDIGNDVGGTSALTGNTITNWGGAAAASGYISNTGTSYCIFMNHQTNYNVSYNTLTSAAVTPTVTFRGIVQDYTTTSPAIACTNNITNNTVTMTNGAASGTYTIINTAGGNNNITLNITNNTILNCSVTGAGSAVAMGCIINSGAVNTINITGNIIKGNTSTATTGGFIGVSNTGIVTNAVNLNNNQIGNATGNAITYSVATSGNVNGVTCSGPVSAPVSVSNNNIQGIVFSVLSTSGPALISISNAGSSTVNVNSNTFTNLNVNTSGSMNLMQRLGAMTATGVENWNNNSIVTGFTKAAGGTLAFFVANSTSVNGSQMNQTGNNFSNVTLTGLTALVCWSNTEGASAVNGPTKTITGNIFSNISGGLNAITGLNINFSGTNSNISSNTFSNVTCGNSITGISIGTSNNTGTHNYNNNVISNLSSSAAGGSGTIFGITGGTTSIPTMNVTGNSITTLSTAGAFSVFGIAITQGATVNCTKNKIADLSATDPAGSVFGMRVSSGTVVTFSNNTIGDLRTPNANVVNPLVGISVTGGTVVSLYYNTVYINAFSTGVNFGSTGINVISTTGVDMRNNIVTNLSVPNGSGAAVAYRRTTNSLANYSSGSNNNSFFAGVPSANHLIYYDGTNSFQTLATYQAFVAPRDAADQSENPPFVSTTASSAQFLHIPAATNTPLESGGTVIGSVTIDYDNDVRPGPAGSVNGGAVAPDIGADEFDGFLISGCNGSPAAGTASANPTFVCGSGQLILSISGYSTGAGITFQWQQSATSGGPYTTIPGATLSYYTTPVISSTTYFVCVVTCTNTALSAMSSEIAAIVNPIPVITVSPNSASYCNPGPAVALTASGGSTYTWSPGTGLSSTTGASVNASPVSSTTYTVTGTSALGCSSTTNASITTLPGVTGITASSSPSSLCAGSSTNLSSSASPYTAVLLSENFNTAAAGWTTINNSTGGTPANAAWTLRPSGYTPGGSWTGSIGSNDNSQFFFTNSDAQGSGGHTSTILKSPAMNTVGLTSLSLQYFHFYKFLNTNDTARVEVSTDGVTWTTVQSYTATTGTQTTFVFANINLNAYIGNPTLFIRFKYASDFGWGWSLDNVVVSGASTAFTYGWTSAPSGFTSSSQNPSGVTPASSTTYSVTITNLSGCSATASTNVTVNPLPTVTASATNASICIGSSTTLTGNGAATYTWNPGSLSGTSVSVSPATTTTYTVTGTSAAGCTNTNVITITVNPLPTVTANATSTTVCSGNSVTLTGSGATSYTWTGGVTNGVSFIPVSTNTYTVTGTDANGCTGNDNITVTVNPTPTVTATAGSPSICNGSSTTLTGNGASTYTWMPGSLSGTTVTVSPTTTTTYTVTGTGASGCTSTSTVTVTVNPIPTVTATAGSSSICTGSSTTLTGNGASTYTWMPGSLSGTTVTVSPTTTTTYTVTGTSGAGCTNTGNVTVTVNPLPTVGSTASPSSTVCAGSSVTLNGTGATTYTWSGGVTNGISFVPVSTTTYTVTGTDGNGCTNTASTTVTVNPLPTVTATAGSPSICIGSSTTLTGNGASTYTWMPGSLSGTTVTVSPTTTTTYTVTGTNAAGCTNTGTVTVTVNPTPTVTATAGNPSICNGSSTTLTGNGASTYTWMPGSLSGTTVTVSPSTTTTYTVTGTSASGCVSTGTVTVTVNPIPVVTITGANSFCAGGNTTLTGTSGGTHQWYKNGVLIPGATNTTYVATTAGVYNMIKTNVSGCFDSAAVGITVTVNPLPTVTANSTASAVCAGNSVTLTGGGATSYTWSGGVTNGISFVPVSTITYTVTGTDGNGCTNTASTTVTVNPLPTVGSTASPSTSVCTGSSVTLNGTGATTYTWSGGVTNGVAFVPVATTTYTVTGTNSNGCSNTATTTITVNPLPTVTATAGSSSVCPGNSTTLTGSGASTYTWMPGSLSGTTVTVTPSSNTTYTITGTSAAGCSNTATVTVTINTVPVVTLSGANSFCAGGNTTLTGTSGGTSQWYQNGVLIPGATNNTYVATTAGVYNMIKTNLSGCFDSASVGITVTVNPLPTVTASSTASSVCPGNNVTLTGGGAASFTWSGGVTDAVPFIPVSTTTYTVTGTDGNGCANTATITVTVNPVPVVNLGPDVAQCSGSAVLDAQNAGSTYLWNDNSTSQTLTASSTGIYWVDVTNASGCTSRDSISVTINSNPSVALGADITQCGGTVTLDAQNAGATYLWSDNSTNQMLTVTTSGTYSVLVTLTGGCTATDAINITINSLPVVALGPDVAQCSGTVVLDAQNAGSTYMWNDNSTSQTLTASSTGIYWVDVTNASGCTSRDSVSVTINSNPSVALGTDITQCGGTVTLDAQNAGATYLWSDNSTNQMLTVNASGTYSVLVTLTGGCTATDAINITINTPPTVTFTLALDTVCLNGGNFTLTGESPAGGTWSGNGVSGNILDPIVAGVGVDSITYMFTDVNGCSGSSTQGVVIDLCNDVNGTVAENISIGTYPNPNNGNFTVTIANAYGEGVLEVTDALGQIISSESLTIKNGSLTKEISLENHSSGVYFVRFTTNTSSSVQKVIIQK